MAQAFAAGLASGKLAEVPFTTDGTAVQTAFDEVVAGMDGTRPTVEVVEVGDSTKVGGRTQAVATLSQTWPVATGVTWTHRTHLTLIKGEQGWQAQWSPSAVADGLAEGETLRLRRLQPPRADVLGAGATALVSERAVSRIGIDRAKVDPAAAGQSARQVAAAVGVDPEAYSARVEKAGPRAFVEAITLRSDQVPNDVRSALGTIPGATVVADELPLALTRDFARPLLGSVGPVTAELIEKNPRAGYVAGDQVGLSGLQLRYDDRLGGTRGAAVQAVTADGSARTLFETPATPGTAVTTTIDPNLQQAAEAALAGIAPASAVVVVQPSTGHVLAAASGPGSQGYSTSTLGRYPPGSTFKVVTALAMLRAGATPDTQVQCPATTSIDGRTFKNYSDFPSDRVGPMTLREALALSCNTVFLDAQLTPEQLADAAASLGLSGWTGDSVGLDARAGSVPTDGSTTEQAAAHIGQGKVTATPLAMATVMASIQSGHTVTPVLVTDPAAGPAPAPTTPLTPAEAAALQEMTGAVVTSGTASSLGLPAGSRAKTGTAEFGTASPPQTHAWIIAAHDDLAVAVFVEQGVSGGRTAGPIAAQVLAAAG